MELLKENKAQRIFTLLTCIVVFTYLFVEWTVFYVGVLFIGFSVYSFFKNSNKNLGVISSIIAISSLLAVCIGGIIMSM